MAQREKFDLTNLIQEVAADGDFEARAHGREVKIVRADACTMSGYPEMLRSAIENVVRNAIRYTPDGASVEITIEQLNGNDDQKAIRESAIMDQAFRKSCWQISSCRFKGFPKRLISTLKEQAWVWRSPIRVVRMHNGSIRALNASDGGLIVEIVLPIN